MASKPAGGSRTRKTARRSARPAFREGHVEADGFRIRYLEAGEGPPLVHLHGAIGLHLTPAHDLLVPHFRVVAFEMPGFGHSAENQRTQSMPELASTMARAAANLGLDTFNLMGTSFGGKVALWLALQEPNRVRALVLEAPGAIRPHHVVPPESEPAAQARRLHAHPERVEAIGPLDPDLWAKARTLVLRLRGPNRDHELESRLSEITTPTLVVIGTADGIIPPEIGRVYKDLMPNCHLVFVYDAAQAISVDRPHAFAEVVLDFLERHEAFIISRKTTVIHP
jgi:pimeloyl-ACP methyl ester carboxylesterase